MSVQPRVVFAEAPAYFHFGLRLGLGGVGVLHIYGYQAGSPYAEDRAYEQAGWRSGRWFPCMCFSVETGDTGDYGSVQLADVVEITSEQFEAARQRGWRPA